MPQSVAGSVVSKHSMKSGKSKASYVDESLFGSNKKIENGQSQMAKAGATILSINELRRIREQTEKGLQKDAAILLKQKLIEIDRQDDYDERPAGPGEADRGGTKGKTDGCA